MCDTKFDTSAPLWWDSNFISGELLQPDESGDTSTLLSTDPVTGTNSYYLPSFFYADDSDPSYSPAVSPNDLAFSLGDYFSAPISTSPEAVTPPLSPTGKRARRRPSSASTKSSLHPSPRSSSTTFASEQRQHSPNMSTSDCIAVSPASTRLRSAKRSKTAQKSPPAEIAEDLPEDKRRARHNHNLVEKKYREHLNRQFERLLSTLCSISQISDSNSHGLDGQPSNLSKAAVLDLACRTIQSLVEEKQSLVHEIQWLKQQGAIKSLPEMIAL